MKKETKQNTKNQEAKKARKKERKTESKSVRKLEATKLKEKIDDEKYKLKILEDQTLF